MNFEILAGSLLVISFLFLVWIVSKKTSELKNLPPKENIIPVKKIKEKIKQKATIYWKGGIPNFYDFLQKTILKMREFFIKADNKMLNLLLSLKQKTDKSKTDFDDYWKDIKSTLQNKEKKIGTKTDQEQFEKQENREQEKVESEQNQNQDKNKENNTPA